MVSTLRCAVCCAVLLGSGAAGGLCSVVVNLHRHGQLLAAGGRVLGPAQPCSTYHEVSVALPTQHHVRFLLCFVAAGHPSLTAAAAPARRLTSWPHWGWRKAMARMAAAVQQQSSSRAMQQQALQRRQQQAHKQQVSKAKTQQMRQLARRGAAATTAAATMTCRPSPSSTTAK